MAEAGAAASDASIHELASELALGEAACARAEALSGLQPTRHDWRRWLDRFLAAAGTLFLVAAVAAFFAWNWQALPPFAKFALIEIGIAAAVAAAWRLGVDSTAGRASLFAAAFLVGVLLAVFGQVYQTGADPYGLFLAWALLILPWTLVARQAGLWLLFVFLLNLALVLYWTQVLHPPTGAWMMMQLMGPLVWLGSTAMDSRLAGWLFTLNAGALCAWEAAANMGVAWLRGRTGPRLLALAALGTVLPPTMLLVFAASADHKSEVTALSPLLFAAALAACLWYYQYRKRDLFMLTAGVFGAILVVMTLAVRYLFQDVASLLALALLLVGQVGAAAWWLREVSRRWEAA